MTFQSDVYIGLSYFSFRLCVFRVCVFRVCVCDFLHMCSINVVKKLYKLYRSFFRGKHAFSQKDACYIE